MIARQILILLIVLLAASSVTAIRGKEKGARRSLQPPSKDPDAGPKEPPASKTDKKLGDEKDKDKKKDKEKEEKAKKDKDKKAKKCKKKKKDKEEDTDESGMDEEPAEDEEEDNIFDGAAANATEPEPYCVDHDSIGRHGDCEALESGKLPKSSTVRGTLEIELTPQKEDVAGDMKERLRESALEAVGCGEEEEEETTGDTTVRRLLRKLQSDNETEPNVDMLGISVGDLAEVPEECDDVDVSENPDCAVLMSDVTIFYDGDADEEHVQTMFEILTLLVLNQVTYGDFDDVANVHFAEATPEAGSANTKSGNSPGMIAGTTIGVLAAVAAVTAGGIYAYKKKKSGNRGAVGPDPGVSATDSRDEDGRWFPRLWG